MPNVSTVVRFIGTVLLVMIGIYAIKWATKKVNIPIVSKIAEEV